MAALDLEVKVSKPKRVLNKAWESYLQAIGRNVRGLSLDNTYAEEISRTIMLTPMINSAETAWTKSNYTFSPGADSFIEGRDGFGDRGYYIGYADTPTQSWSAYLNASTLIGADVGLSFSLFWSPPTNEFTPYIEFFPRIDYSKSAEIYGRTYYFSPFCIVIDNRAVISVYEYEYDTYDVFLTNPAIMMTKTAQFPLLTGSGVLGNAWIFLTIIPVEPDGFVIKSPQLKDGGALYFSNIQRENLKLFPKGSAGIRSVYGGLSMFNIVPVTYPASGTIIGPPMSKRELNSSPVSITEDAWLPSGTYISSEIIDPVTQEPVDTEFKDFTYKLTLNTSLNTHSPVIHWIKTNINGETSNPTISEVDISDDVISIKESTSVDLMGYKASIKLRNRNGIYNELALRPLNQIDINYHGEDRAVVYTLNPSFNWWESPTEEALFIEWECGDEWVRLNKQLVASEPAYDGINIKTAITNYLQRRGYQLSDIDIEDIDFTLPASRSTQDKFFKPEDGKPASDFLRTLYERFLSNWIMRFTESGKFYLHSAPAPTDIRRIFYLSRDEANAAMFEEEEPVEEDYEYFVYGPANVSFDYESYYNEIIVIGYNDTLQRPIVAYWLDKDSQINEEYLYYVGERRLMIIPTRFNNEAILQWILDQARIFYGKMRRKITFKTKIDNKLKPGDFIQFYGSSLVWKVLSMDSEIASNVVDTRKGDSHQLTINAIQWPIE
ncbi:MAG: hypothetical protein LHW61_00975 [Candidatus Cloacimonetes bacterium]|nr:hypothetical protein [Candidatus Cloacimonadota bacterium]